VAESEGGALRLEIAGAVRESLGELALLRNRLQLAEHEWRTAQALERDVAQRVEAGELARTDLLLARDETLNRQALYLGALAELENGEQRYRALTGMDRVPPTPKEPLSTARVITQEHPRLAEVQAAVDRARAEVESVRQDRLGNPELTLGTRHEKEQDGEPYSNTLGVSVRVPLGSRAHAAPRVAQAELALAEAQAARDAVRRELETRLQQAQNTLRTTRAAVALAQRQHELAQENLRLARKAFALGETDLVGLLRVQSLAFAAERNLQQRGLQLELDIARYNQAIGVIP
jgi:outer membrane protein TolC